MTFLLEQNVPGPIARVIQPTGHKVLRLRDHLPIESSDRAVLAAAAARKSGLRRKINFT